MESENSKLVELKKKQESFRTRLFLMMIEIAFVFAVPAAIAVFAGKKLDSVYGSGQDSKFSIILLVISFVISWIIVIIRFRRATKALKNISKDIEREKHRNG